MGGSRAKRAAPGARSAQSLCVTRTAPARGTDAQEQPGGMRGSEPVWWRRAYWFQREQRTVGAAAARPAQTHTSSLLTEQPPLTERSDKALGDIPVSSVSGDMSMRM